MFVRHVVVGCGVSLMLLGLSVGQAEEVTQHQFSGDISLGMNDTAGNTDVSTFDGKLALAYNYQKWSSDFTFKASQTTDAGTLTSDYYEAILKNEYDIMQHTYAFLQLGYREDVFGGIYSEKTYIAGLGYRAFAEATEYSVDFELGYGERVTKKLVDGALRDKVDYDPGIHLAVIAAYNFTDEDVVKAVLSGEFGNDDDYIKKELSWTHHLFADLSLDFSFEQRTLTAPAAGKVETDSKTSLKLGYGF